MQGHGCKVEDCPEYRKGRQIWGCQHPASGERCPLTDGEIMEIEIMNQRKKAAICATALRRRATDA